MNTTPCQRIDFTRYVVVPIWYGCNNDCGICMLGRLKKTLPPMGFDGFRKALTEIRDDGRFDHLILSGAEVTTFGELEKYVRFAASLEWFKRIQIQTNGRNLSDQGYLARLVNAGINEFFLSVHGLGQVHDNTTGVTGSFAQWSAGLDNLAAFDVNVITNTVLTRQNYHGIATLLSSLLPRRISEFHLWNYCPMEPVDTRDAVVSMKEFRSLLSELLAIVTPSGRPLVLKSFPECLSMGEPGFFDNEFPVALLPRAFWQEFDRNKFGSCVHKEQCRAKRCWGLCAAYTARYGDERTLLHPLL